MNGKKERYQEAALTLGTVILSAAMVWVLWAYVPRREVRFVLLAGCAGILALTAVRRAPVRRQVAEFSGRLCEILDSLIAGEPGRWPYVYEDSLTSKVQGKLLQFYDIADEARKVSSRDKKIIQELVSDISHQVKTPMANIRMFAGILKEHDLPEEKRRQFLETMEGQIGKLDFLMQFLIKMSRLETGTFVLKPEKAQLSDTIARALSLVWTRAEKKGISLDADCDSRITVRHDPKWTAEAIGNILDNAVKYTPEGGSISVQVRPWQIYTRIDITDTGMGIDPEHYHDIFQRFYRAQEAAGEEGVGLGLYLAQEIVRQRQDYLSQPSGWPGPAHGAASMWTGPGSTR